MDILIVLFSPAGSTLKIGKALEDRLAQTGNRVQLLDVTREKDVFKHGKIGEYLARNVRKHDVICIGSPVYEKHVEAYVGKIYESLPEPDAVWGKHAVSFFTYGGISTGTALAEAERLLTKGGRTCVASMKLEASHIKTAKLTTRVNENMPGDEALPFVAELAGRINAVASGGGCVKPAELDFQNLKEKIVCAVMKEKLMHRHIYGKLTIDAGKCAACMKCEAICPIRRIDVADGRPFMTGTEPECIHCFSCVNACASGAITYENGDAGWAKIERIFKKVAKEGSVFRSGETPRSAVYPIASNP